MLSANGQSLDVYLFVPEGRDRLSQFVTLQDRKSKVPAELEEDAVLLTEKAAERLGVAVGDTITVQRNDDHRQAEFTVGGVVENSVQNYIYLSPALYEEGYHTQPEMNQTIAVVPDGSQENRDRITSAFLESDQVQAVSFTDDIKDSFQNTIKSIDFIVIVLIVSAGLLAFVVLYNLTNINITERQKEIATIKVLGFYDKEVSAYIYRETGILTLIGTAIGLIFGIFLHAFVVKTAEVDMVDVWPGDQVAQLCVLRFTHDLLLYHCQPGHVPQAEKDQYGGVHEIHRVKNLVLYDRIIK